MGSTDADLLSAGGAAGWCWQGLAGCCVAVPWAVHGGQGLGLALATGAC